VEQPALTDPTLTAAYVARLALIGWLRLLASAPDHTGRAANWPELQRAYLS